MLRRLLCLAAFSALAGVTHCCRCVDPVTCPEAVVSSSPESCKLPNNRPGVCCPGEAAPAATAQRGPQVASARRPDTDRTSFSSFRPNFLNPVSFPGFGDSSDPVSLSSLPGGARKFLKKFPLDSADQSPPQRRPNPPGPSIASSGRNNAATATPTEAKFTLQSLAPPSQPSGTTRLNFFNARSSAEAQRLAADSLVTLSRVRDGSSSTTTPAFQLRPQTFGFSRPGRPPPRPSATVPGCNPERPLHCDASARHRTIDGSCNNLRQTRWGSRLRGLRRLFDTTYDDWVFAARSRSVSGGLLPSARYVSALAMSSDSNPESLYTMGVTTFGQFMDHDLSISPIFQLSKPGGGSSPIECCEGKQLPAQLKHPQCLPISVPANDHFYSRWSVRCMNFVRSIPTADPQCRPRPATQLNDLTSWMDLSQVYGSYDKQSRDLRTFGGKLRTSAGNLLPREPATGNTCKSRICFIAGDERVNENTLLTLFHTVFMREHNRVVEELTRHHRFWRDERLFQEARRIVIAEWQHIAYNEWLPAIVGYRYARQVGLRGYGRYSYASVLNPTISAEFSTAGFRLHSMVQGVINLVLRYGTIGRQLQLTDNFFKPDSLVLSSMFSQMARGLTQQEQQSYDKRFTRAIHGNLFKVGPFGLDLVALNIQRGRDHGIPTYATVAAVCNGFAIRGWSSFYRLMTASNVASLRQVYGHWQDVDLFAGLSSEGLAAGALVGPTARCLLADQFLRARYADRFFYDQAGHRGSFSGDQLGEIRKASWARLLCDNVLGGFDAVQPLAFIKPISLFGLNPVVSCDSYRIRRVDLHKF